MIATMTGMKIILTQKWEVEEAAKLIKRENVAVAGGVPAMVSDMSDSSLVGHPLEGLLFGGAPAPDSLVPRARKAFPTATMIQGYGLTETNSIAVSFAGEDYIARPSSTGLASPVNDIMIMWNGGEVPSVRIENPNAIELVVEIMILSDCLYNCVSSLKPLPNNTKQCSCSFGVSRLDTPCAPPSNGNVLVAPRSNVRDSY